MPSSISRAVAPAETKIPTATSARAPRVTGAATSRPSTWRPGRHAILACSPTSGTNATTAGTSTLPPLRTLRPRLCNADSAKEGASLACSRHWQDDGLVTERATVERAVLEGDLPTLRQLHSQGVDVLLDEEPSALTALHLAAGAGRMDSLE